MKKEYFKLKSSIHKVAVEIAELKILPYFGKRKITEIKAADVRLWQNELMKKGYSQTYLRSVNNQLAALFNYATKYYELPKNSCNQAGTIGKGKAEEMKFWTQEEFERFLDCVKDKPVSYYGFLTLYWTGCRIGELLALTLEDFNAEEKTLRINKSYQRINGKDVITPPKTEKGKRMITLPDYLVEELKEYVSKLYAIMPGKHKEPTIAFRPSSWQRTLIEERAKMSGLPKKDFIARSCIYANIIFVGKKEVVQKIINELQETQITLREVAGQLQSGNFSLSMEGYQQLKEGFLAIVVTMVDILDGAAYLFDKKPDNNRKGREQRLEDCRKALLPWEVRS